MSGQKQQLNYVLKKQRHGIYIIVKVIENLTMQIVWCYSYSCSMEQNILFPILIHIQSVIYYTQKSR